MDEQKLENQYYLVNLFCALCRYDVVKGIRLLGDLKIDF